MTRDELDKAWADLDRKWADLPKHVALAMMFAGVIAMFFLWWLSE